MFDLWRVERLAEGRICMQQSPRFRSVLGAEIGRVFRMVLVVLVALRPARAE
jgi:hypothetical protein